MWTRKLQNVRFGDAPLEDRLMFVFLSAMVIGCVNNYVCNASCEKCLFVGGMGIGVYVGILVAKIFFA